FARSLLLSDRPPASALFPYTTLFRSLIGMTAGAPIGSLVTGRLFGLGFSPQVIMQISAVLLLASLLLYLVINGRQTRHAAALEADRKSTRLNSSHVAISYAVFCLKNK